MGEDSGRDRESTMRNGGCRVVQWPLALSCLQIDAVRSAIAIIDEMLSGVPSVNTTRERVTERDRVIETETRKRGG